MFGIFGQKDRTARMLFVGSESWIVFIVACDNVIKFVEGDNVDVGSADVDNRNAGVEDRGTDVDNGGVEVVVDWIFAFEVDRDPVEDDCVVAVTANNLKRPLPAYGERCAVPTLIQNPKQTNTSTNSFLKITYHI